MLKTVVSSAIVMLLVNSGLGAGSATGAETPPPVTRLNAATSAQITLPTAERNWREWFLCGGKGACGGNANEAMGREPVNILHNPKVQADERKPVNSLLFTIDALPGTLPGLKIGTP